MLVELGVVEQRYDAVMEVVRDGLAVVEVAARYGVSRQTVHTWIRRYEAGGLGALGDRSHRPASCPHQMSVEVEAQLCELRRRYPDWGPTRLVFELGRQGAAPSRSGVYRALVRNGLIEPQVRKRRRGDYRRWERSRAMELWQMDVMGGVMLVDGTELKLVTSIDDHSRYCVAAGVVARATARPVCAVLAQAMKTHGVPEEILTDNGKVFTGRFGNHPGEVLFDRICRENGIEHRLTKPRSPTTTGKIERFHKTIRGELLDGRTFNSEAEAQAAVDAWVHEYNTQRPHQSLGMLTPAQRFLPDQPSAPAPPVPTTHGLRVQRRVWSNGVVRVAYQAVSVGRPLAGQIVTVEVGEALLRVFHNGALIKAVPRRGGKEVRQTQAHKPHKASNVR